MSAVQKILIGLAIVATGGGWGYGRFGTEKTETVTVMTVRDAATAEEQAEGEHAYRITTDKGGIFKNDGGVLALKFGTTTEDLQSYFKVGNTYKITSYDPLLGDKNVTEVIPVDASMPAGLSGQTKEISLDFNGQSVVVQIPVEAEGLVTVKGVTPGQTTVPQAPTTTTGTTTETVTPPTTTTGGGTTTPTTKGNMPGVPTKEDLSVKPPK